MFSRGWNIERTGRVNLSVLQKVTKDTKERTGGAPALEPRSSAPCRAGCRAPKLERAHDPWPIP